MTEIKPAQNLVSSLFEKFNQIKDEEAESYERELEEKKAEITRQRREEAYIKSGIAEKFEKVELSDLLQSGLAEMRDKDGNVIDNVQVINDFISDVVKGKPRAILIFGEYGTGKSVFSLAVMHELCKQGVSCAYFKSHEVMQRLEDVKWHCSEESRQGIIGSVCKPRFRIIDEVGRYPDMKGEQFVLYDVTNRCYESYKSSIYITNLTKKELAEFYGGAVIDRFKGVGMTIEFTGKSFRGTEKELYTK